MIEEQAEIISLKGEQAIIQIQRQNACQSCELSGGCGTGSLGRLLGVRQQTLSLKNDHHFVVGEVVTIGLPEKHFLYAGFLVYLFPLISLFIFAMLSDFFFDATQWINALAAVFGLILGLMYSARLSNTSLSEKLQPRFIRREISIDIRVSNVSQVSSAATIDL